MRGKLIRSLTKEYLNLVILPYSLAVMVWILFLFTGTGYDWALIGALALSLLLIAAGWKKIFIDSVRGRYSGLYRGLPATEVEQRCARILAAAVGIAVIWAGFAVMTILIWDKIEFWGAQYVYSGTDQGSRHYAEWLHARF